MHSCLVAYCMVDVSKEPECNSLLHSVLRLTWSLQTPSVCIYDAKKDHSFLLVSVTNGLQQRAKEDLTSLLSVIC